MCKSNLITIMVYRHFLTASVKCSKRIAFNYRTYLDKILFFFFLFETYLYRTYDEVLVTLYIESFFLIITAYNSILIALHPRLLNRLLMTFDK